jgi:hypothetical protein
MSTSNAFGGIFNKTGWPDHVGHLDRNIEATADRLVPELVAPKLNHG